MLVTPPTNHHDLVKKAWCSGIWNCAFCEKVYFQTGRAILGWAMQDALFYTRRLGFGVDTSLFADNFSKL